MIRQVSTHAFIIMAKQPAPGRVKTRIATAGLGEDVAAAIAAAMLRCTARRMAAFGADVWLAVTPDGTASMVRDALDLPIPDDRLLDQRDGDLGNRLDRIWRHAADRIGGPVTFFGMDSPDIPAGHLEAIATSAGSGAAAWAGPTPDGGYWAIGGTSPQPTLLQSIDWGTSRVYDQTCDRAREGGIDLTALPHWDDVDDVADIHALQARLSAEPDTSDAPLCELRSRLNDLLHAAASRTRDQKANHS